MNAPSMNLVRGYTGDDIPEDSIYNQCVRCGLCLPTCPTYLETMVETSGPRGRIGLIKAVGDGELDLLSPGFVHQMSECLDCRACEAVCPSGVMYGQLVEAARTQIQRASKTAVKPHVSFARFVALRILFTNLAMMRFAASLLRFYQGSPVRSMVRACGLLRFLKLEETEKLAPQISQRFFVARNQRYPATVPRTTAFLHTGCIMHVAFAEVHEATVRVLQRSGCTVIVPQGQGCCGAITVHAGEMQRGRELAKRNIAAFERSGADVYLVNAAGCGSTLKDYGKMFARDKRWSQRAARFSKRVRDVSELLDELGLAPELGEVAATATYQEACHLVHAQRVSAAPRRLLGKIPGLVLREMAESSVCCGSAGIYNLTQPEMAQRLQARKISNIQAANPDFVITANPGCALQISAGLAETQKPIAVRHIVQVLDLSYQNYERAMAG
ncbi:MAG: heterodisulfide reductase-related iron-sulfur binding cluster [Candidatus Eremiobacteraeota bacterium]|nr:heterodisulfide reductase-related iron-sulfur binding cluster [Candidatus Eremiobacteraeota bacterium]